VARIDVVVCPASARVRQNYRAEERRISGSAARPVAGLIGNVDRLNGAHSAGGAKAARMQCDNRHGLDPVAANECCQDRVEGMEDAPEKRPSFPGSFGSSGFVRAVGDQTKAELLATRPELVGVHDRAGKGGAPGSPAF
jgi:hypothetical protein